MIKRSKITLDGILSTHKPRQLELTDDILGIRWSGPLSDNFMEVMEIKDKTVVVGIYKLSGLLESEEVPKEDFWKRFKGFINDE